MIKAFSIENYELVNEFTKTVNVEDIKVEGQIVTVFYNEKEDLFQKELKEAIEQTKESIAKAEVDLIGLKVILANTEKREVENKEELLKNATNNISIVENNLTIHKLKLKALTKECKCQADK